MSSRITALRLTLCRVVLIGVLPTACAVGVTPEAGDTGEPVDTAGSSSGGMLGAAGSMSVLPKAGTTSSAGTTANPFGGSASTAGTSSGGQSSAGAGGSGGKAGSSSGGAGAGGAAGSTAGGSGGTSRGGTSAGGSSAGGSSAGGSSAGGSSAGGSASGGCACAMPKKWADDTNLAFGPGDCLDVAGAIYLYTGAKAQTWAQKACNPTMQAAWCSDISADYKFMLCK